MTREHHGGRGDAGLVSAEHGNGSLAGVRKRDHRAVARLQAGAADRVERDAGSGERFRADENRGGRLGRIEPTPDRHRQVHRRRLEAQARRDVACRRHLAGRGLLRQDDARVDEIDGAVAVAILEDDAGLEEVREGSGDGNVGSLLTSSRQGAHERYGKGEEQDTLVHTGEFISTKQKGTA